MELNNFFFVSNGSLGRSVSYFISEKVKIDNIFKILSHMVVYSCNNEKTEDITTFTYYWEYS